MCVTNKRYVENNTIATKAGARLATRSIITFEHDYASIVDLGRRLLDEILLLFFLKKQAARDARIVCKQV